MKKISIILLICMIFALFCSCEQEIAESSKITNNDESNVLESIESEDFVSGENSISQTASENENKQDQDLTVSIDVSYADSSSRKPQRPSENSKPVSSEIQIQLQTSTSSKSPSKPDSSSSKKPIPTSSAIKVENNVKIVPIKEEEYYGYLELQKKGTEAEKKAYQVLKREIGNYQNKINFDFDITREELERAYYYYKDDYPQHFWHGNTLFFKGVDDKIDTLILNKMICNGDAARIKALDDAMKKAASNILKNVNGSMTPLEREEYIHNYLVNNCRYEDAEYSHTSYGAIVNGRAVCEGYANAFQYLMRLAGVQCINIKGDLIHDNNEVEIHEWNMIKLDGEYYHVDVTSDDPVTYLQNGKTKDVLKFTYFNVNDAEIKRDHIIKGNLYDVPKASAKKYNYYNYYKLTANTFTVDSFAKAFAHAADKGYERASIKVAGFDYAKFGTFFSANYYDIVEKCNEILGKKKIKVTGNISYVVDNGFDIVNIELNYV